MEKENLKLFKAELARLKKRMRVFKIVIIVLGLLVSVLSFLTIRNYTQSGNSIVTQKIIVQDRNGNDRIIISPEISSSQSRQRSDTLEGILILDEKGTDRVVLGATPSIQSNGEVVYRWQRSVPYGLAFNDSKGNERGGFGYYDSRDYVSFGMDYSSGEGLNMFVSEKGHYGQKVGIVMQAQEKGQVVYLGASENLETMLNLDVPGKARLSLGIDSAGDSYLKHFNYPEDKSRILLGSK